MKFRHFEPITHTLIARGIGGQHMNGTGSRGDLDYAKRLARSWLLADRTGIVSIDIYRHERAVSWRDLQSLATVTLDDEDACASSEKGE
jgi:hypothetical protein